MSGRLFCTIPSGISCFYSSWRFISINLEAHFLQPYNMKKFILQCFLISLVFSSGFAQSLDAIQKTKSQWNKKRVAFLGDSMTQKWERENTPRTVFWEYLMKMLDLEPFVYGISGNQWDGIYRQAVKLEKEHGAEVDAILIFAGTNDYNHNLPLGKFYNESVKETNVNGNMVYRKYRTLDSNDSTFCGRINKVMTYLKHHYPDQQIVIMTPIHRGYAAFNVHNVQPEESFSNALGLYIDDYVQVLRDAASVWAVPLIDLYSVSGLYPMETSNAKYFMNAETDLLHPGSLGNLRMAETIRYQLMALPATFKWEN